MTTQSTTTVSRFLVQDDVGPRGVQVHRVSARPHGDIAHVEWNVPFSGESRDVFEVPVAALHETWGDALAAAIARKRELGHA